MSGGLGEEKLPMSAVIKDRTLCGMLEWNRPGGWMWRRAYNVGMCFCVLIVENLDKIQRSLPLSHGKEAAIVPNGQRSSPHWQSDRTSRNCQLYKETPMLAASVAEVRRLPTVWL